MLVEGWREGSCAKKKDVGTRDTDASPSSLPDAVEQVNGALLRLIKNYAGDFSAIAQEAGTPPDSGLNLANANQLGGVAAWHEAQR